MIDCKRTSRCAPGASLDWPLSREEKRNCVMRLYEKDVRAADHILRSHREELKDLRQEVRVLRRNSRGSLVSTPADSRRNSHSSVMSTTADSSSPEQEADDAAKVVDVSIGDECHSLRETPEEHSCPVPAAGVEEGRDTSDSPQISQPQVQYGTFEKPVIQANKHMGSSLRSQSERCSRHAPGPIRFDGQIMKDITGSLNSTCHRVEEEKGETEPPLTPEEARLHSALTAFYEKRRMEGKVPHLKGITRRYASSVPELWAAIATRYTLPPAAAVQWLAVTLGPFTPVLWPKQEIPESASRALEALAKARMPTGTETVKDLNTLRAEALQSALAAGDIDAIRALAIQGCPSSSLRPHVWRALLSRPARGRCLSSAALEDRRASYRELRARAIGPDDVEHSKRRDAFRAEVEADARTCWRGEAFMQRPEVFDAVVAIVLTTALRYSRHIRGCCEIAALLLFALSGENMEDLAMAEADAFWCLAHLINELQGTIADDLNLPPKVQRFHWLLRTYDPALAETLATHNLEALPATRLGVALCTRAGFSLETCVRLWDSLLTDPRRFEMCDFAVLGLLLVSRGRLLQKASDAGDLAEALLAAPRTVDPDALLRTTFAICAFERRCGPDSNCPYPPQPGVLDVIANNALDGLARVWGGVRARGAAAWRAGRGALAQPASHAAGAHGGQPQAQMPARVQSRPVAQAVAGGRSTSGPLDAETCSHAAALQIGII